MKYLYYCFGGGLGHITRFNAFCNTFSINPVLLTASKDVASGKIKTFAEKVFVLPEEYYQNKEKLRGWVIDCLNRVKPNIFIIDTFLGGILGELTDLEELNNVKVEYIARILKLDSYQKRIKGYFPKISKIWKIEEFNKEQNLWLEKIAKTNKIKIKQLQLKYPDYEEDSNIELPDNPWVLIHSGSENELSELYEYAKDTALLENIKPNFVIIGQVSKPSFLPPNVLYYNIYPVNKILKKAQKVISGAGFNIMQQMKFMKEKHIVMPFERPLDDQFLRKVKGEN